MLELDESATGIFARVGDIELVPETGTIRPCRGSHIADRGDDIGIRGGDISLGNIDGADGVAHGAKECGSKGVDVREKGASRG
jgi:hypothetical protein